MIVEKVVVKKLIATEEEKQKLKGGLEALNTLDNNTNDVESCQAYCPLKKMCDNSPCQIGCLIHFSQKIFQKLDENL